MKQQHNGDTSAACAHGDVWESLKDKLGITDVPAPKSKLAHTADSSQSMLAPRGDGQRTDHLTSLAGMYLARGFDLDQVTEHCLMWNQGNMPPLDPEKVISTCESIAASDARNHPNRRSSSTLSLIDNIAPPTPLFNIADARIDDYLRTSPPARRWVLDGFLPLGIVAAVVAQGGAGKSQWLMQLGYAVATGLPLAGYWNVGEQGTVLMLCAEDSPEELHRRVHRIHQQVGNALPGHLQQQLADHFLVRSVVGMDLLLTQSIGPGEVVRTGLTERLLLTAAQAQNLKLIILDPASRFRGGDENSNADATRFVQALEYLAQNTGATVLIAHHSNKGAINSHDTNQTAARGASALTDGIRWQMALTPMTSSTKGHSNIPADERRLHLEAKLVKTNYTAPQAEVLLKRQSDGYLQSVVPSTSTMANALCSGMLRAIQATPNGITARQLEIQYGGVDKPLGISERELRKLVAGARSGGLLKAENRQPLTLTPAGMDLLQRQPSLPTDAVWHAPRGGTARRKKTQ